MKNVQIAFKIGLVRDPNPVRHQQIRWHMIFDIKIEIFKRKARFAAGGNTTETHETLTYPSVVSRESVRIALTLVALNDLDFKTGDIMNAYQTALVGEKIWCICGTEFGVDAVKPAIIKRALYVLKASGASFRNHLSNYMQTLGYTSC